MSVSPRAPSVKQQVSIVTTGNEGRPPLAWRDENDVIGARMHRRKTSLLLDTQNLCQPGGDTELALRRRSAASMLPFNATMYPAKIRWDALECFSAALGMHPRGSGPSADPRHCAASSREGPLRHGALREQDCLRSPSVPRLLMPGHSLSSPTAEPKACNSRPAMSRRLGLSMSRERR